MALAKALERGNCRLTSLAVGRESRVAVPLHGAGLFGVVSLFVCFRCWFGLGWRGWLAGAALPEACVHA